LFGSDKEFEEFYQQAKAISISIAIGIATFVCLKMFIVPLITS